MPQQLSLRLPSKHYRELQDAWQKTAKRRPNALSLLGGSRVVASTFLETSILFKKLALNHLQQPHNPSSGFRVWDEKILHDPECPLLWGVWYHSIPGSGMDYSINSRNPARYKVHGHRLVRKALGS